MIDEELNCPNCKDLNMIATFLLYLCVAQAGLMVGSLWFDTPFVVLWFPSLLTSVIIVFSFVSKIFLWVKSFFGG